MHIEVRAEFRSRQWREVFALLETEVGVGRLSAVPGSIVGTFREGSIDLDRARSFYAKYEGSMDLHYEEVRTAYYDLLERHAFKLHAVLCETVSDIIPREENYSRPGRCEACGRRQVPVRLGPMILRGDAYRERNVLTTEMEEVVVSAKAKRQLVAESISGVEFLPCVDCLGMDISDYFLLQSRTRIGRLLAEDGVPLYCKTCGQWAPSAERQFPPWYLYSPVTWDGSDAVFSIDNPPVFCGTLALVECLARIEHTISLERCIPIHFV